MNRERITVSLFLVAAMGTLLACHNQPPKSAANAQPEKARPAETAVAPPPVSHTAGDAEADVLSQDLATLNKKGYLRDAYFDFDKAQLRDDARTSLSRDADWLRKYGSVQVLLEGHCDDRGTEAYNLVLGEQRANASREYLVALGLSGSRIKTISYGKDKPFCAEDTEGCWQENRRAHVLVTAK